MMFLLSAILIGLTLKQVNADVREKLRQGLVPSSSIYGGLQAPFETASTKTEQEEYIKRLCNSSLFFTICQQDNEKSNRANQNADLPSKTKIPESIKQPPHSAPIFVTAGAENSERTYLPPVQIPQKAISQNQIPSLSEFIRADSAQESVRQVPPQKISNQYLPAEDQNVSPESTNISPNIQQLKASQQTFEHNKNNHNSHHSKEGEEHSLERLCNDPFHSFLCVPTKGRKKIDGKIRAGAKIPPNILEAFGTSVEESHVPSPSNVSPAALENKTLSRSYLPVDSSPTQFFNIQKPSEYDYFNPIYQEINYSSSKPSSVMTTSKPTTATYTTSFFGDHQQPNHLLSNNVIAAAQTTFNYSPNHGSSSSFGYLYPKPTYQEVNSYQHSTSKPTYRPPLTTTTYKPFSLETQQSFGAYQYTKPSSLRPVFSSSTEKPFLSLRPFTTYKPPTTTKPSSSYDYTYQKPTQNVIITVSTQKPEGYIYTHPSYNSGLTLQTTIRPILNQNYPVTTVRPAFFGQSNPETSNNQFFEYTTQKPHSTSVSSSTVRPETYVGYTQTKPSQIFTFPTTTVKPIVSQKPVNSFFNNEIDTRPLPSSEYYYPQSTPTTAQTFTTFTNQFLKPQNGYVYPKPSGSNIFLRPSSYKPIYPTFSTKPTNYISSSGPGSTNGYQYITPQNQGYTIPITTPSPPTLPSKKPTQTFSISQSHLGPTTTHKPFFESDSVGSIKYERPINSFNYPKPNASSFRPSFINSNQYSYIPVQTIHSSSFPSNGFNNKFTTSITTLSPKPTQTFQTSSTTIQHTYPSKGQQTYINSGYDYLRPEKPFVLPSRPPFQITSESEPYSTIQPPHSGQFPGYNYPRPANPFHLPPRERPSSVLPQSTISTTPTNSIAEIEDLQPLRNFEILKP